MNLGRRQWIGMGAASAVGLLSGCETLEQRLTQPALPSDALPPTTTLRHSPAVRILNRAAYGPRPGDVAHVEKVGVARYVEEQLHPPENGGLTGQLEDHLAPQGFDDDPAAVWRVRSLGDCLNSDTGILFDIDDRRVVAALRQATLIRAIYSRHQLRERMTEFWSDHFNIYAFKGQGPQLTTVDNRQTIRNHALGQFGDLLSASARSAAMLGYLDNTINRKGVPNENYARELMELHTLGVDGGYTQRDVKEVARCLTGWTMERHWRRGRFQFDTSLHDDGAKHVLGEVIPPGGGIRDGERVLAILSTHPSTARHISRKLCVAFVGEAHPELVGQLSQVFLATKGSLRAMLRTLLASPQLMESPPVLKRPYDFVVSAMRALNADTDGGTGVQQHLEKMGQPLFAWPRPDGFPQKQAAWTGTLLQRWNFAMALTAAKIDRTSIDLDSIDKAGRTRGLDPYDSTLELAFGCRADEPSLSSIRALKTSFPQVQQFAALALMSPEFQWR